jgi:hypothetical protein
MRSAFAEFVSVIALPVIEQMHERLCEAGDVS